MTRRGLVVWFVLLGFGAAAWAGPPGAGAAAFRQGDELLAKGDFDGALKAYQQAAKAEPENQEYKIKALVVERVQEMRGSLDQTADSEKWLKLAQALHNFYDENDLNNESLALAMKAQVKLNSPESAAMLARSRLALGMNSEAASGLREVPEANVTEEIRVLLALAMSRQGQLDDARKVVKSMKMPEKADCRFSFDLARVQARLGLADDALQNLTCALENTPPPDLERVKSRVRVCEDFAALRENPGYAKALESKSKLAGCAADCGKCPMKDKGKECPSGQGGHDGKGAEQKPQPNTKP